MKTVKAAYWISTSIIGMMMVYSAYMYLSQPAMAQAFQHLGYPGYFRVELAVAKLIGVTVLLAPFTGRIKEWAYAGFAITFVSAFISHTASGDPAAYRISTVVFLILLAISYITYHRKKIPASVSPASPEYGQSKHSYGQSKHRSLSLKG